MINKIIKINSKTKKNYNLIYQQINSPWSMMRLEIKVLLLINKIILQAMIKIKTTLIYNIKLVK